MVRKKVEEHTTKGSSSEFSEETPNSRQSKIEKPKIDGFHVSFDNLSFALYFIGTSKNSKTLVESCCIALDSRVLGSLPRL